jgi:hypothetical protein
LLFAGEQHSLPIPALCAFLPETPFSCVNRSSGLAVADLVSR